MFSRQYILNSCVFAFLSLFNMCLCFTYNPARNVKALISS